MSPFLPHFPGFIAPFLPPFVSFRSPSSLLQAPSSAFSTFQAPLHPLFHSIYPHFLPLLPRSPSPPLPIPGHSRPSSLPHPRPSAPASSPPRTLTDLAPLPAIPKSLQPSPPPIPNAPWGVSAPASTHQSGRPTPAPPTPHSGCAGVRAAITAVLLTRKLFGLAGFGFDNEACPLAVEYVMK